MSWFADTSLFVAHFAPKEAIHEIAEHYLLHESEPIVTTQWVLAELGNSLSDSMARTFFTPFVQELHRQNRFLVLPADDASFQSGIELYHKRPDKLWSLVDCISFETMTAHNIRAALTTDHHFEQAGFSVLLK